MSTRFLTWRSKASLFHSILKTERQLVQAYSATAKDDESQPRTVPYKKIKYDLNMSKPRRQNYSMFTEHQQTSQATSSSDLYDQVKYHKNTKTSTF